MYELRHLVCNLRQDGAEICNIVATLAVIAIASVKFQSEKNGR